jgi:outer membrane protein assembly factor BamE (lipoprotein component of BamABCDE complex)
VEKHLFWQSETPFASGIYSVTAGKTVTDEQLNKIKRGITTKSELVDWFGPPTAGTLNVYGDVVMSWSYAKLVAGWTRKLHVQQLNVLLNSRNVVRDFAVGGNFGLEATTK